MSALFKSKKCKTSSLSRWQASVTALNFWSWSKGASIGQPSFKHYFSFGISPSQIAYKVRKRNEFYCGKCRAECQETLLNFCKKEFRRKSNPFSFEFLGQ